MSRVIGIDLGTTNSAVAVMEGGVASVIPNREGARTTPSIVAFTHRGETLVGQVAKRQAVTNPENTIYGAKRLVGRAYDSEAVRAASRMSPYRIVRAPNGDAHVEVEERAVSPSEIEAIVLRKLKEAAEDYLGEPVERAIVSVPAYFNDAQRQATRDAGTIAGLAVHRILNESTAAALAYGMSEQKCGTIAVYDLGGGTFDVSILELQDGLYQVLATVGDTYLGGEDFDESIARWLVREFHAEHGIDVSVDPMARQRLKEAAEKAKCELSTQPQVEIALPFLSADASGPKHLTTVLSRTRFEVMIRPMLEHTAALCRSALDDAGVEASDIDIVVPVGGQTRTPAVFETIAEIFDKEPVRSINPDEAVAIGAAIQTGILQGQVTDLVLLDVTPHTLGIEAKNGTFTPIIERNSNIPTKLSRMVSTTADHQPYAKVHVLQGESTQSAENTSLARFRFGPIPPAPAGRPQIAVTFELDVNGILQVEARDVATGETRQQLVRASGGLTVGEIAEARDRLVRMTSAELDHQLLESLLRARQSLDHCRAKLSPKQTAFVEQTIRWAGSVRNSSTETVRSALRKVEDVLQMLARAMLGLDDDPSSSTG